MTTPVIFRRDRDGTVFALFPAEPSDWGGRYCSCYQHVGQHSGADFQRCIQASVPATPAVYADPLAELNAYGDRTTYVDIKPVKRRTATHRELSNAALREWKRT